MTYEVEFNPSIYKTNTIFGPPLILGDVAEFIDSKGRRVQLFLVEFTENSFYFLMEVGEKRWACRSYSQKAIVCIAQHMNVEKRVRDLISSRNT